MNKRPLFLLDLGGVVFQSTGQSNALIDWDIISQLNHLHGHELNIGGDKFPSFMADYNRLTQQQLSGQAFLAAVFDTLQINRPLIDFLSSKGDILIVSDNYRENIAYISKRYNFEEWAIGQVYSYDYGMVKTHPKFFARLLNEWKAYDREQMLFIDDSPRKIESARKHGIRSVLFRNNKQLMEEIKKETR